MIRRFDHAVLVCLAVLAVLAVLPLWARRSLPLYDDPAHLVIPAVLNPMTNANGG